MKGLLICVVLMGSAGQAPEPKRVQFQPGVVIDWAHRQVEIDSTVVLREGLLELVACTPKSREHEALVRVNARAVHIYMALGLIGLQPGKPASWDFDKDQPISATGDPVAVLVRFARDGKTVEQNVCHWLLEKGKVMAERHWVFAGSVRTGDGDLVAQREGTIVTVVDFGDALLGLAESHSADNEELWLEPNTPAIPALGTDVTLILRALPQAALVVTFDAADRWGLDGKPGDFDQIVRVVRKRIKADPMLIVVVKVSADAELRSAERMREVLGSHGVPPSRIRVEAAASSEKEKRL